MNFEEMKRQALALGACHANIIGAEQVVTDTAFRDICVSNGCGIYGKCWMCPPDVGEIHELMATLRTDSHALV